VSADRLSSHRAERRAQQLIAVSSLLLVAYVITGIGFTHHRRFEQPSALRAAGLDFPAAVISELELKGHAIERVHEDERLVGVAEAWREMGFGPECGRSSYGVARGRRRIIRIALC
jgi:hypothetical protein